ncbi:hypothetical protein Tco_0917780 [Tanacetum coccineum]
MPLSIISKKAYTFVSVNMNLPANFFHAAVIGLDLLEDKQMLSMEGFDNAQIDMFASLFVAKYRKSEEKNEEIKFYTSTKNPESRLEIRIISRAKEPTIRASKSQG